MMDFERLYEDADKGVLPALKILGDIYLHGYDEDGMDIKPDLNKAIEYYEKAAEGDFEDAFMDLGYIYCSGEFMPHNYEKGIGYYKKAADKGNTTALGNLGMSYLNGYGVEKDEKKGFEYFLKAAEGGHPMAMDQVAILYRDGVGVGADNEKSVYWEKRAEEAKAQIKAEEEYKNNDVQTAFEKNLKFISKDTLDVEFAKNMFENNIDLTQYTLGKCEFKTGKIITADPLFYLKDPKEVLVKAKSVKAGTYPVQVALLNSKSVGLRVVGARLKISEKEAVSYELANCIHEENQKISFAGFGVECGMACFCDKQAAESYWRFLEDWFAKHKDGNIYTDYFEELFQKSYEENPNVQRKGGDLLIWSNPLDNSQIAMFASGMGDGYYTDYWGIDADGEICELVIVFMDPDLF